MSLKKTKRANIVRQYYVENDVPFLELDLSAVIGVSCYSNIEESCVLELEFSLLDNVELISITFISTEEALKLYDFILENAKNLVKHDSEF